MTAADRPSVTDEARTEAEQRFRWEPFRNAFVAGAEWATARTETTATTEDAAQVIDDACYGGVDSPHGIAQALADAGLLARPTPSRKELMRAAGLYGKQADAVIDLLQGGTP